MPSDIKATSKEKARCKSMIKDLPRRKENTFRKVSVYTNKYKKFEKGRPNWISLSPGYIYLSYEHGRSYWVLCNITPKKWPRIKLIDSKLQLNINTFRVKFDKNSDYQYAKKLFKRFEC